MLRTLLKMLFDHRTRIELEFIPIRPIPMARQPRTYRQPPATISASHRRDELNKQRSNQLSS
jgi:hypothetical protein